VTKWHPSPSGGQADLYQLSQEPVADTHALTNGVNGVTELLTAEDGRKYVRKAFNRREVRNPKEATDAEQLSALVAEAVGVRTPTMVRTSDREYLLDYVSGTNGAEIVPHLGSIPPEILDSEDGRLMGLLDLLIKNGDRNPSNWFLDDDGRLVAIDHGFAMQPGESPRYFARRNEYFSARFRATMDDEGPNDITPAQAAEIRARLEPLRGEFARLGREDWWVEMMTTMERVQKWAQG
jgi:hypothetical protein